MAYQAKLSKAMGQAKSRPYVIWGQSPTFTSKSAAYRYCREINGKKAGGHKPYNVQRIFN